MIVLTHCTACIKKTGPQLGAACDLKERSVLSSTGKFLKKESFILRGDMLAATVQYTTIIRGKHSFWGQIMLFFLP